MDINQQKRDEKRRQIASFVSGMESWERDVFRSQLSDPQPLTGNGADMQSTKGQAQGINRYGVIALENVDDCFTYHPPNGCTLDAMNQVRESSIAMAKALLRVVPDCPDRSTALRKLREARMWANSALALGGRF